MVIYFKPMSHQSGVLTAFPQRLKNCRSSRCALCKRQQRWTDRPTDRRTDATKQIHYSPHDKKVCRRYKVDTKCYGRKDGRAL